MKTTIRGNQVVFQSGGRTKDKHPDGSKVWKEEFVVTFHRTLRLPEDGRTHALPPSLGHFPIKQVDDYKDTVPKSWLEHGGIFIPMWQREAMWLSFHTSGRPHAVKVAAGKINAVSGKPWTPELSAPTPGEALGADPAQDYMVSPPQPWLDGFNTGSDEIKQFVAMPLGQGYTVEKQVTGKEEFGGIQLMVVPPKEGKLENLRRRNRGGSFLIQTASLHDGAASIDSMGLESEAYNPLSMSEDHYIPSVYSMNNSEGPVFKGGMSVNCSTGEQKTSGGILRSRELTSSRPTTKAAEMGLGAGGKMKQKVYPDTYGVETWDLAEGGRLYIHIVNSQMYEQITGEKPPESPIDAATYTMHGYPWFNIWDQEMGDVQASKTLSGVKTIGEMDVTKGMEGQQNDSPVHEKNVTNYKINPAHAGQQVRDGKW